MLILLYIILGLLFFDCLAACGLYFREKKAFDPHQDFSDYLMTLKSTQ